MSDHLHTHDASAKIHIPESLIVTKSAANKIAELIREEGNFDLKLRIYITGGGCSGFQYGFAFEEQIKANDTVIEKQADEEDEEGGSSGSPIMVRIIIDPMSFQYLAGAEVDYVEDINGERFVIRNPNAETTCGCGSSFAA